MYVVGEGEVSVESDAQDFGPPVERDWCVV